MPSKMVASLAAFVFVGLAVQLAGATSWESDNEYPWLKKDFPLQKFELNKTLTEFADKFIEKQGKEDVEEQDQLLKKLTDKDSYLPASKYSVSVLYYKVWQLERSVYYLLSCLTSGPQGPPGPPGPAGADGAPGPQGPPGANGTCTDDQCEMCPEGDKYTATGGEEICCKDNTCLVDVPSMWGDKGPPTEITAFYPEGPPFDAKTSKNPTKGTKGKPITLAPGTCAYPNPGKWLCKDEKTGLCGQWYNNGKEWTCWGFYDKDFAANTKVGIQL